MFYFIPVLENDLRTQNLMFFLHDFGVLFGHMIVCCICYRQVIGADEPET